MDVILLERIETLGQMGDVVNVKNGYARNYLLPQQKALRATKENKEYFEKQRKQLEAANLKRRQEAEKIAEKMKDLEIVLIRQAGETGHLYGSVRAHDVREGLAEKDYSIDKSQVDISSPIKEIGVYPIRLKLHPEVDVTIKVNIAKSDDEADTQRAESPEVMPVSEDIMDVEEIHTGAETEEDEKTTSDGSAQKSAKSQKKSASKSAKKESKDAEEADSSAKAEEADESEADSKKSA